MGVWLLAAVLLSACEKELASDQTTQKETALPSEGFAKIAVTENFETGTKTAYATASVSLSSGSWTFNDALLGNSTSDRKTGTQSARIRNAGKLTMNFNKNDGIGDVTIKHARYGTDAASTWQLYYSTTNGSSWTAVGTAQTASATTLTQTLIKVNVAGAVRLELRKTDGSTNRINIDDISIGDITTTVDNPVPTLSSLNPTSATAGTSSLTLTANGSNFVQGATINWNGTALTTNFVSSTQLSTTLNSTQLATAGTANISITNPAPGGGTSNSASFTINAAPTAKRFLFDNRHQQTAGNADWVMDQDNSVAARYPTPSQTNITASTSETYWTGGISAWGISLVKLGHSVETLPTSGSITFGNASNAQDLSNYQVFVVDEPNTLFSASEKTAILQFVQNGGSLMMIANHDGSDRNNDGWDAPRIWNDLMTNNTVQNNPFGFSIDLQNYVQVSSNVSTTAHPVLNGTQGNVSTLQISNGTTLTLNTTANPNARGLIWTSSSSQSSSNVFCAVSTFGTGRVFFLGDSSPTDDGTGAPGNTLYNGWSAYSHSRLLLNASLWCAKVQ